MAPTWTQFQITQAKSEHDEDLRVFREYTLMQRALIQQVLQAIDGKYLSALRNRVTGQIPNDTRSIMSYLFRVYGQITPAQLQDKEDTVKNFNYSMDEPIDSLFNEVEDLQELGELSGTPYSMP